jgi:hypothetical protein
MNYSSNDKNSLRKFVMPLLILVLTLFGILDVRLYSTFFTVHKFLTPVPIIMNLKIDIFGAILPLFIGLACAVLYLRQGGPKMTYAICFLFSLTIALAVSHVTTEGLMINPAIILFGVSSTVVFLVPFFLRFKEKSVWKLKESYVLSLLIASSCIPFSLVIVDLCYFPFFNIAIIGGYGLADGVLLSTLYSPFTVTQITLIFSLVLQAVSQTRTCRRV